MDISVNHGPSAPAHGAVAPPNTPPLYKTHTASRTRTDVFHRQCSAPAHGAAASPDDPLPHCTDEASALLQLLRRMRDEAVAELPPGFVL